MDGETFYNPGELIHFESPFAHVLYKERQGFNCDHCLSRSTCLKRCGNCKFVSYCGKKCQKEAWPDHKEECKYLHRLSEERDNFVRLIGKVIFKLKGKDWRTCSHVIGNATISFADLISHSEEMEKNPRTALHLAEVMHLLEQYIGQENLPEEKDLVQIIGKVKHNRFNIGDDDGCNASGLYLGASFIDHSCIPTAVRASRKTVMEIRALQRLSKSDISKVTISYVSMIAVTDLTKYLFDNSFYSPCYCVDCSLPYGESVLTKIIDKKKAFSAIELTEQFLDQYKIRSKIKGYDKNNVNEMLKKQEGILGDTNLLRIRLLSLKCSMWPEISDLKKLIEFVELAFGKNSPELTGPLNDLRCAYMNAGRMSEMAIVQQKMDQLIKIQYGDSPDPQFAPNLEEDLFCRMLQNVSSMHRNSCGKY